MNQTTSNEVRPLSCHGPSNTHFIWPWTKSTQDLNHSKSLCNDNTLDKTVNAINNFYCQSGNEELLVSGQMKIQKHHINLKHQPNTQYTTDSYFNNLKKIDKHCSLTASEVRTLVIRVTKYIMSSRRTPFPRLQVEPISPCPNVASEKPRISEFIQNSI